MVGVGGEELKIGGGGRQARSVQARSPCPAGERVHFALINPRFSIPDSCTRPPNTDHRTPFPFLPAYMARRFTPRRVRSFLRFLRPFLPGLPPVHQPSGSDATRVAGGHSAVADRQHGAPPSIPCQRQHLQPPDRGRPKCMLPNVNMRRPIGVFPAEPHGARSHGPPGVSRGLSMTYGFSTRLPRGGAERHGICM